MTKNKKKQKEHADRYEKFKAARRKNKIFKHLEPKKVNGVYELEYNGRTYRNEKKKALFDDIGTVENGLS